MDSFFTLILQEKIAKFELSHQKKVLDECSSTLEFFLVKYVHISFWSADVIFSTLMKNTWKIKIQKKVENKKNSSYPSFVFCPKFANNFFSINDFFAKITFSCSL